VTATVWQVVSDGKPMGEYPEPHLVNLASQGRVNPNDLFWRPGMPAAAPAHTLAPFERYFRPQKMGDDAALRWVLPVGRSPWAIAAGYLGIFSVLLVFGPLAIGAGILGLRQMKRKPHLHGKGRALFGIIAGSLGTCVLVLLLLPR
jgi:hypothetical protein